MKELRTRDTRIPRRPLLLLAAGLIFTLPPMFGMLATWVPLLFLATLLAKFWMEPRGIRLRSIVLKLMLAAGSFAAVAMSYGSLRGVEPGVSLLVVLMSLKVLEAHTAREFRVMVMVAWVLCLCGFILSQNLAIALSLLAAFVLLLSALIQFHRGAAPGAFWPPMRVAGKLLLQALPLIALLFLLFPRVTTGFRFPLAELNTTERGFSEKLSPGSVTSIANSEEVAFRAEFPDGRIPPRSAMYWRGAVMQEGAGLEWQARSFPAALPRSSRPVPAGDGVRQRITLEPHNARWMFALDWPAEPPPGSTLAPGHYLWSGRPIRKALQYEVRSYGEIALRQLSDAERANALAVPDSISPAVRELAASFAAGNQDPRAIVKAALEFFGKEGFRYTLAPGEYKQEALDEFLLRRRLGFCEHYAGAFATLMRLAGVPSRVVVGYLGGEFNAYGRFFQVRQSDAHAWCEVWLPDRGWERIDPTSVVAPDRVNLGFTSFLERRAAAGEEPGAVAARNARVGAFAGRPFLGDIKSAWDAANFAWDTRVLSFDAEAQQELLAAVRLGDTRPLALITRAVLVALAVVVLYAAWMRRRVRARADRVKELYDLFCRKIARAGVERRATEGPADFTERATRALPEESEPIRQIRDTYIRLRYAPAADSAEVNKLAQLVDSFGRGKRRAQ